MRDMIYLDEIEVEVTRDDISNGVPEDCDKCAVALAMKRCVTDFVAGSMYVDGDASWTLASDYARVYCQLPEEAKQLIQDFDEGKPVNPIKFKTTPKAYFEEPDSEDDR